MPTESASPRRQENLALVFQEILTAVERLRSNRQAVADAENFRAQMREALRAAETEGRKRGYAPEEVRMAMFAVVALLDETILNLRNPLFAHWPRKPMQEELFGGFTAGEIFYQNIDRLLQGPDTNTLADVLEVYELCILLGYGGRHSVGGKGELRSIRESIGEKIRRIRGHGGDLSPAGRPGTSEAAMVREDQGVKRWMWAAVASFALMLALWIGFKVSLGKGAGQVASLAARGSR